MQGISIQERIIIVNQRAKRVRLKLEICFYIVDLKYIYIFLIRKTAAILHISTGSIIIYNFSPSFYSSPLSGGQVK